VQARSAAPNLPFQLEYPRTRHSYAGAAPDALRLYDVRDQHGHVHPIYAIVVDSGPLGAFYDVQGTSWEAPPLLSNPSETAHVGSRTYELFYVGEQIRTVAWREGGATYWVQNTLTNSVGPREMLAIAEQTVPIVSSGAIPTAVIPSPSSVKLPTPVGRATSLAVKLGSLLALVSLAALALLALQVIRRQRELQTLREQVARAIALEARQRPLLATAGVPSPSSPVSAPAARRIYRAPRRWRRRALAGGLLAILATAAVAVAAVRLFSAGSSSPGAHGTVPVAVYNATGTPGAAHRVAATLAANHLRVGKIGQIRNASLARGAYVLYPPGAERQARQVARLIPSLSPTVTPIQPQVQNTVGAHDEIVVVLD
jgi:hypothetical protein